MPSNQNRGIFFSAAPSVVAINVLVAYVSIHVDDITEAIAKSP
jgi:hypothetical protein